MIFFAGYFLLWMMGFQTLTNSAYSAFVLTSKAATLASRHRPTSSSCSSSVSVTDASASNDRKIFWADPLRVADLPDPPSSERIMLIQEKPYRGGFEPAIDVDEPYLLNIVFGSIPTDLVGSLATNGAGRIRVGDTQYGHWFDGDGYVSLLGFNGKTNEATFNGKYIRSGRFKAQQKLMEKLRYEQNEEALSHPPLAFSGAWTMLGKGKWYENIGRFPTSPANTATMWLESTYSSTSSDNDKAQQPPLLPKLYAICEGGHPIQLNPQTLDVIEDEKPFVSADGSNAVGSFFSAHFKRCPMTGDVYNHGFLIRPGPLAKEINIMKLSSNGSLIKQAKSPLPFDCFTHDSAMSSSYLIFFLPPYYIPNDKLLSLLSGTVSLGNLLEWHEEGKAYVQINAKDDLKLKCRIELPNITSLYHFVDAHDETNDDGSVCLKVRIAEHEPLDRIAVELEFTDQYRVKDKRISAVLKEYTFHLEPHAGESRFVSKRNVADDAALCEYPTINSSYRPMERRRYCWTNALSDPNVEWLDGLQKIDMEMSSSSKIVCFGAGNYAGPPTFVPREVMTSEDDGYVLVTVYRSAEHRSDVVVLDAATLEKICIMELRQHLPFQFHGDYLSNYLP